jgi:hypothetical protein
MKRVFSAWRSLDGSQTSLWEGDRPPQLANGDVVPGCDVLLWQIEVGSYEEAMAIRNIRLGVGPYVPLGDSAPCPKCGVSYYPSGSAQCWNCDHVG